MTGDTFSVLFVCTANQCRSPMAERLAKAGLVRRLGPAANRFRVFGAGTRAVDGIPITPMAAAALTECGIDADGFVSSELRIERIAAADLVLTLERMHRKVLVALLPSATARTFTLKEFARIASTVADGAGNAGNAEGVAELPSDPVARAGALVLEASRRRAAVRPSSPEDDDIADPIGQPIEVYRTAIGRIGGAVESSLTALTGLS